MLVMPGFIVAACNEPQLVTRPATSRVWQKLGRSQAGQDVWRKTYPHTVRCSSLVWDSAKKRGWQLELRAGGFSPAYIILMPRHRLPRRRHRVFWDRGAGGRSSTSQAGRLWIASATTMAATEATTPTPTPPPTNIISIVVVIIIKQRQQQ